MAISDGADSPDSSDPRKTSAIGLRVTPLPPGLHGPDSLVEYSPCHSSLTSSVWTSAKTWARVAYAFGSLSCGSNCGAGRTEFSSGPGHANACVEDNPSTSASTANDNNASDR